MRRLTRWNRVLAVMLAALAAAGCARRGVATYAFVPQAAVGGPYVPAPVAQPAPVVASADPYLPAQPAGLPVEPYRLDSGDRLRVQVFGQDGLTNSYIVDAAGNISLSLIGPVAARGFTTAELARAIAARLQDGYIRQPHVSVEVEAYRPFFILGEVNAPGPPLAPHTRRPAECIHLESGIVGHHGTPRPALEVAGLGERISLECLETLDVGLALGFGDARPLEIDHGKPRALEDGPQLAELSGTARGKEDRLRHAPNASRCRRSSSRIPMPSGDW